MGHRVGEQEDHARNCTHGYTLASGKHHVLEVGRMFDEGRARRRLALVTLQDIAEA